MPDEIQYLLIAESPPPSGEYFYSEKKSHPWGVFWNTMRALYGDNVSSDVEPFGPKGAKKTTLLKCFKVEGFYLLDAILDRPLRDDEKKKTNDYASLREIFKANQDSWKHEINNLQNGIKDRLSKNTKIIFIGKRSGEILREDIIKFFSNCDVRFTRGWINLPRSGGFKEGLLEKLGLKDGNLQIEDTLHKLSGF